MAKEIEVLIAAPGTAPRLARVEGTLEAFEQIVGGPVETGCILPQRVLLFYNGDENRREWGDPSRPRAAWGKAPLDGVAGTVLLCGCKGDRFTSLPPEQKDLFLRWSAQRMEREAVPLGNMER